MKPLMLGLIALNTIACANQPASSCGSLKCMLDETAFEIAQECERHLHSTSLQRKVASAIRAEYQYPLTNAQTYLSWVRMGNSGPSPWEWCNRYAQQKVRSYSLSYKTPS